jgi:hypothetical protein
MISKITNENNKRQLFASLQILQKLSQFSITENNNSNNKSNQTHSNKTSSFNENSNQNKTILFSKGIMDNANGVASILFLLLILSLIGAYLVVKRRVKNNNVERVLKKALINTHITNVYVMN